MLKMKHMMTFATLTAFGLVGAALAGGHAIAPVTTVTVSSGEILANSEGFSLYTWDRDESGKSNCYDSCATSWPPLLAENPDSDTEGFSVISRKDGSLQWTQNGQPLYTYVSDEKPGDVSGDGVGGTWHLARP